MRIIAGPCQHEGLAQSAEIAKECKRVCDKYGIDRNDRYVCRKSYTNETNGQTSNNILYNKG